jgi:hypothetical protein
MSSIGGFFRSIALIWRFGDSLAPLLETLGRGLPAAADAMITSGQGAVATSKALRADGGLPVNAQAAVDGLKESIRQSRELVGDAEGALRGTADAIRAIKVPAVAFTTTPLDFGPLGRYNFATGMSVTEISPFQPVHDGLDGVAALLHDLNTQLLETQRGLRDLSNVLATTGGGLKTLGEGLQTSGELLKGGHN